MKWQRGFYMTGIEIWIGVAIVAVLALAFISMYAKAKKWHAFRAAHNCKVVGHIRGEAFNTFSSNGSVGVGFTGDKTGWLCDDGVTYYR